jgi:hypothetical protein
MRFFPILLIFLAACTARTGDDGSSTVTLKVVDNISSLWMGCITGLRQDSRNGCITGTPDNTTFQLQPDTSYVHPAGTYQFYFRDNLTKKYEGTYVVKVNEGTTTSDPNVGKDGDPIHYTITFGSAEATVTQE